MTKPQLTPWFSGIDTPERIGVYERLILGIDVTFYSHWDGRQWWPSGPTPRHAAEKYAQYRNIGVPRWCNQLLFWRGIRRKS